MDFVAYLPVQDDRVLSLATWGPWLCSGTWTGSVAVWQQQTGSAPRHAPQQLHADPIIPDPRNILAAGGGGVAVGDAELSGNSNTNDAAVPGEPSTIASDQVSITLGDPNAVPSASAPVSGSSTTSNPEQPTQVFEAAPTAQQQQQHHHAHHRPRFALHATLVHGFPIRAMAASVDHSRLYVASVASDHSGGSVTIWSASDLSQHTTIAHPTCSSIRSLTVTSSDLLCTAHADGMVRVWGSDGSLLASLDAQPYRSRITGASSWSLSRLIPFRGAPAATALYYAAHSGVLYSGYADGAVHSWNPTPDGRGFTWGFGIQAHNGRSGIAAITVSPQPDYKLFTSSLDDSNVRVWSAKTGFMTTTLGHKPARSLGKAPIEGVQQLLIWPISGVPDSYRLLCGMRDRTVREWVHDQGKLRCGALYDMSNDGAELTISSAALLQYTGVASAVVWQDRFLCVSTFARRVRVWQQSHHLQHQHQQQPHHQPHHHDQPTTDEQQPTLDGSATAAPHASAPAAVATPPTPTPSTPGGINSPRSTPSPLSTIGAQHILSPSESVGSVAVTTVAPQLANPK